MATKMQLPIYSTNSILPISEQRSKFPAVSIVSYIHTSASLFGKRLCSQLCCFIDGGRISLINDSKRSSWSIRSNVDGSRLDPSLTNNTNSGTRLIRAIQDILVKFNMRINEIRKNLPMKLLFFLVGFYCATAFATVIGQTGDWDILSAALAVVVVEGIGALMYGASLSSLPLFDKVRGLITMFNYWKAGLSLGLFLDSFKY